MANQLAPRMERRGGGGVNRLLGIIEPAMTVGSAIAAEVPALAVGLGSLNTIEDKQRPLSDAVAAADEVREMLTYDPRSMEGQAGMQSLINSVSQLADTVGLDTAFQVLNEEIIPRVQSTLGEDAARELGSMAMMIPAVRRLSGLPMDTASRMQRAKEMGFDDEPSVKRVTKVVGDFDPRFDPRAKERNKLKELMPVIEERQIDIPEIDITELSGKPFITSMSDRTRAGANLIGIGDVEFNDPVRLQGGQDYMFENPGQVWASAKAPASKILKEAQRVKEATGEDPLLIPWRMAPTGGDFATMTGETMLQYASAAMPKGAKRSLNARMKKIIPGWTGIDSPEAIDQFRASPDKVRKQIKQMMDVEFRDRGGIGIGAARLSVVDPDQINLRDQGIMNVGKIFPDRDLIGTSGHAAYSHGVPGEGVGKLTNVKEDASIFDLVPEVLTKENPRRAMEMKPYTGVITDAMIEQIAKKYGLALPVAAYMLQQGLIEDQSV